MECANENAEAALARFLESTNQALGVAQALLKELDDLLLTSWTRACLGDLHYKEPAQDTYKAGFLKGLDLARQQLEQVRTARGS